LLVFIKYFVELNKLV